jgi:hypothetical protein
MESRDPQLTELLENIREIKSAIKQNSYIFQLVIYNPFLKLALVIVGLMSFFVPIFYYLLLKSYPSYGAIPFEIRLILILAIILGFLLLGFAKLRSYFEARQQRPKSSLIDFFSRLISRQVLSIYPVLLGGIIFFLIYFLAGRMYHLIVPTIAIGMGICFSIVGAFISLPAFFILGNYFWITGMLSVPFIVKTPGTSLLWVSGIFGLGMLGFGFYLIFVRRASKEHTNETA